MGRLQVRKWVTLTPSPQHNPYFYEDVSLASAKGGDPYHLTN